MRQTEVYLDGGTAAPIRGMAEMLLIKLGELVHRPHSMRVEQAEVAVAATYWRLCRLRVLTKYMCETLKRG